MDVKLSLSNSEYKELTAYCNLNDLLISEVVKKSFLEGFNIERYGLLSESPKVNEVIKEVEIIREVPIEKIVEVIREVPVEKIVEKVVEVVKEVPSAPIEVKVIEYVDREVIREVPVEKIVEKIVNIYDNSQIDELLLKIQQLEQREPEKVEIVKEILVEVIKEVPVEVIKEVVLEKLVGDESKQKMLEQTLLTLRSDIIQKDKKIKEMEEIIQSFEKYKQKIGAVYLRGSNLDETL
jgi:hypothetical protein